MDELEKLQVVRTNNTTVMIVAIIVGIILLIIGIIWAYAKQRSKGRIVTKKNKLKKSRYNFGLDDEEIESFDE